MYISSYKHINAQTENYAQEISLEYDIIYIYLNMQFAPGDVRSSITKCRKTEKSQGHVSICGQPKTN